MKRKKMSSKKIHLFVLFVFLLNNIGNTQNDNKVQTDSLLVKMHLSKEQLFAKSDSIKLQDSLQEALLLAQIKDLEINDKNKKEELIAKIDSLNNLRDQRNKRIKKEVDSLRLNSVGVPVLFFDDTLFHIYTKLGAFSPLERAERVQSKIETLVDGSTFDANLLKVFTGEESADIIHGDVIILSISDRDAFWRNQTKEEVAKAITATIISKVNDYREQTGVLHMIYRTAMLLLVIIILFFGIKYMNKLFTHLNKKLFLKCKSFMKGIRLKEYEFVSVDQEMKLLRWFMKMLKWILIIFLVYLSLPVIFSIFPSTKGIASTLIGFILNPVSNMFKGFIGFIPELITITVIITITLYFIKFLKFIASEIKNEKLVLPGFYSDWAIPTFNLLKVIVYAFSFIVIFPYLPGSNSPIFQGVSVFLGLLISLGSSSAISNIIAGLVITYMRAFKIGDRVKIGDTIGDVIAKTMLVTRIRTIKNENVTIPNASIMNGSTINYTSSAKDLGLILNTTVTIGYDVPWRKVHDLLISAALKTNLIQKEPTPFVLQTSLDDFYVSYQINAYTYEAAKAAKIYSELYGNIQDGFNEAGLEILSPHYRAERDGNMMAVPSEYLPKGYKAPSFNFKMNKDEEI